MLKTITFTNKVVVITGAGGVLCGYMAKEFAKAGAKVALLDLNQEAAQTFADEIVEEGGIAKAYKANVLSKENLEEVHQAVLEDLGPTDILVNGAGGNNPKATTDNEFHELDLPSETKTFFELDEAGISFVFNLNYLGTLLPTQVFAQDMVGREGANIINISSMNAFTPLTKIPAYSGAKAAISNFTQWLAVHFSKVGIRCNAIAPGFLVTNQNRSLLFTEDGQPTARAEKILNNTPMGRFGEASELIGGLFFLADEKSSSFVNGVVLPIDGGFAAYSGV
ncbi:TPA: SDR family oxidoreductase [Streptococcus agalactiae]|nr:SDR family oxidoreductase [Streptococcus agalactiae]